MRSHNYKLLTITIVFYLTYTKADQILTDCDSEHSTVCLFSNGTKTCCPSRDAICCQDIDYCCPRGFKCETKNQRCIKDDMYIPYYLRTLALDSNYQVGKDVLCPDNTTICKETQTCCLFGESGYGCCPLLHAQCCDDKVHCCPKSYKCNPSKGKCDKVDSTGELFSIKWFEKQPGNKINEVNDNNLCPDQKSQCPSGSTCCQLSSGDWGCCPLSNAVCCEDHLHCCPEGYTCDVKAGRCNKGNLFIPFLAKTKATPKIENLKQECPGGSAECPSGSTCCQLSSGDWGCCPIPKAVCCEDHQHCCPSGYVCDVKAGRCSKGEESISFYKKFLANLKHKEKTENQLESIPTSNITLDENSVVCPDGCSFCPNGYTCCKMNDQSYGCCPLPNAVCCEDHLHCCPQNTHCNLKEKSCDKNGKSVMSWLEKIPSKLIYHKNTPKVSNDPIVCADNVTTCDPMNTCCKMGDGSYGCCPYVDGVCCSELSFCCPSNSVCGKQIGECITKKLEMEKIEFKASNIENEKIKVECEGTVCQIQSGQNVCCPYMNGTCCGTHGYCCPKGYNCNSKDESCQIEDPDVSQPNYAKQVSLLKSTEPNFDTMIECPDSVHYCPDSSTCCKTKDSYGCCAIENAVCCDDGVNCCPQGYLCATNTTASCLKKSPELTKLN